MALNIYVLLKVFFLVCAATALASVFLSDRRGWRIFAALDDFLTERRANRLAAEARLGLADSRRPK